MKKLRLTLEELAVDSFATQPATARRGTVAANATTGNQIICDCPTNGYENTCRGCSDSCGNSCEASCNGTCAGCPGPTADATCDTCAGQWTCGGTCEGYSCQYCTQPGQFICA